MSDPVHIGDLTLHLGDCLDVMRSMPDKAFDLAIVDPPYFDGPNRSGYYGKGYSSLGVERARYYEQIESWEVPEPDYFAELRRVSRHQIIWGANHFANRFDSAAPGWIVWDKLNGASTFADAELAYSSLDKAVRVFRYVWNGMHQGQYGGDKSKNEPRIHPTQKPVALYEWLLDNYARAGQRILDTHMGSGSSAIAALNRGFEYCAVEKSPQHFHDAVARIRKAAAQPCLPLPAPEPESAEMRNMELPL
jgi:site-specific DNA-methyltransferase (adenine-specific)